MATIRSRTSGADGVAEATVARDDIVVKEREVAPGRFVAEDGPFRVWERDVRAVDDGGAGPAVTQELRFAFAAPLWGRVLDLGLRRMMRVPPSGPVWWAPPVRLTRRDAEVLARSCTLAVITGFLGGLVTQTIAFAARDFGEGASEQSASLAFIRIGALVTLVAVGAADRWGRRRLIRIALAGASIASFATAFAPSLSVLTVTQLCSRGFVAAAALLIAVVCAEEMPARARAFGIGLTALSGGLGVGMVLWCLPIIDTGSGSWRLIFLLAAPAGLVAWRTSSALPETWRFVALEAEPTAAAHINGRRLVLIGLSFFLLNCFAAPTSQLQNDYLTAARGLSATGVMVFLLATNTWAGLGVYAGSRFSDKVSRRGTAAVGLLGFAAGNAVMFSFGGAAMWIGSLCGSIIGAAIVPSLGALQPELFPTARRGLSSGWTNLAAVGGSVTGFLVTRRLIGDGSASDYGSALRLLALAPVLAAVLMFWVPETAGAELEALNPDEPPG